MANGRSRNRITIVGAGRTGTAIAREIQAKRVFGRVVAFLDDDPGKIGKPIHSIPVLGPIAAVVELLKATPADEAIIAIPGATREQLARIYALLRQADFVHIRHIPGISEILSDGGAHLVQAREINPEDLLSREPVQVDLRESLAYVRGKRVLVTGAGGSIGGELSRQLLFGGAQRLYLLGHGENSIYQITRELRLLQEGGVGERATIVPVIGELQDRDFVHYILQRLRADVVFHAAAHKHVPLSETNPVEAIKNNVFGTRHIVDASRAAGVSRFVLISTDKAVDPMSIYGSSKLLAEEIVLRERKNGHHFLVVRFGNVLGSRGSILPLFRSQILKGGPVTITDPEARRFFMTIPEAVSLVLKAGGVGEGGELYLLDMGEPVLIRELAEKIIRFEGFKPEEDIPIVYTGLRPGEKKLEKLWRESDRPESTPWPKILRLQRGSAINGRLESVLKDLHPICFADPQKPGVYRNRHALRRTLMRVIPQLELPPDEPEY